MAGYRIIWSDDHVFEPPDLWTSRVEAKYLERAPRMFHRDEDNTDWWICDGVKGVGTSGGVMVGERFEDSDNMRLGGSFENVRLGGYIPDEHVKDMDIDGIDVSVMYPNEGLVLYRVKDRELLNALFKVYNDWIAEFCQAYPDRLKGIAMLNVDDVGVGVKELERCAGMGLVGAMITVYPPEDRPYASPEYEPLWSAAVDLEMPLSLHIVTNRMVATDPFADQASEDIDPVFFSNVDHWVRMSLAHMIFGGVFERHSGLRVGSIEMEASWVPHFLDRMDYNYTQRPTSGKRRMFRDDMLPSDYFHRNVFVGFQEDHPGVRDRHIIGVENLLWGSDYPHPESTWPRSREILEEILADCTEQEKAKIVGGNAERIYRLN